MSYYLLPKNNNAIIINPCTGLIEPRPYISHSLYNFYHNIKIQIGSMCCDLSYNEYVEIIKIVNPTEYIFSKVPGSKFSVSKLKPKTNLFYEYLEITSTLNIFEPFKNKSIKSLHISDICDDSIECIEMIRENYNNDTFISFEDYVIRNQGWFGNPENDYTMDFVDAIIKQNSSVKKLIRYENYRDDILSIDFIQENIHLLQEEMKDMNLGNQLWRQQTHLWHKRIHYNQLYTQETADIVYELKKKFFEFGGYEKDSWKTLTE